MPNEPAVRLCSQVQLPPTVSFEFVILYSHACARARASIGQRGLMVTTCAHLSLPELKERRCVNAQEEDARRRREPKETLRGLRYSKIKIRSVRSCGYSVNARSCVSPRFDFLGSFLTGERERKQRAISFSRSDRLDEMSISQCV